jgi:hypothetical protein
MIMTAWAFILLLDIVHAQIVFVGEDKHSKLPTSQQIAQCTFVFSAVHGFLHSRGPPPAPQPVHGIPFCVSLEPPSKCQDYLKENNKGKVNQHSQSLKSQIFEKPDENRPYP